MKLLNVVFFVSLSNLAWAQTLTLTDYKNQVLKNDPQTQSLRALFEANQKVKSQADLMTGVQVFADANLLDDQRTTVNPRFQGDRTAVNSLSVGLQQQTRYGLKWSLSQNFQKTKIENADSTAITQPEYNDAFPKLELSLPLWRNWLGSETQAEQDKSKLQLEAAAKQAEINWIQRQAEVEEVYFQLLSKKEVFDIQKDSLGRAEKIENWTQSRFQRNLVDEGDFFQAQAAVQARQLDVIKAEVDLKNAARIFNSLRNLESEQVSENLKNENLDLSRLKLNAFEKKERLDLQARQDQIQSQKSMALAEREKLKPSLDLQVQGYTQGRGNTYSAAERRTFQDEDYLFVGVGFSMPLDQVKTSQIRSGYSEISKAQEQAEQSRLRDVGLTWSETVEKANQLKKQVEILRTLEVLERKKADSERNKLNRGRSTTFQVLNFEQDYNSARNQRINLEFQARQFINSLALYK